MSDLDSLIELWQQRLAAITTNANELSDAESTKRIRIKLRAQHYTGNTQIKAEDATRKLSSLVDDYVLLAKVVEEAARIHKGGMFSAWANTDEKVTALLEGPSIVRTTAQVSIKNRDLLGSASVSDSMTPEQLLAVMQTEFEQARDSLNEIDYTETHGTEELAGLRRDYSMMEERAQRLNAVSDRPSFIEIQDMQSDPLNAQRGKESLKRALMAWSTTLDQLENARATAANELEQAKMALAQLQIMTTEYQSQLAQVRDLLGENVVSSLRFQPTLSMSPMSPVSMLLSWCETLESSLQAGQWAAVNVGASKLNLAIAEALANGNKAIAEVQTKAAEAEDLNGRFIAYKAKDKALTFQYGTEVQRQTLRAQIDAELKSRPLNLDVVRSKLMMYQDMLTKVSAIKD
ncbi:hypothetical protein QN372_06210 [Undibacterium sp. RTI2.1]|uniref:hypothetical protein n=1 Tax=unclassified Undibacterium TaxID=2630295 RepID=UPI002AB3941C|nr:MULTISPECIES: hypothetical protein [unclassified Undibacterium]MDY7540156.1 hypothetical protein [Undibacterium sp. 5I1]MEB0030330.1 hypothetical protein [Undibacterium sp. RTI2.1]MEB0115390.1 hypothetical protein [Undibacterium sp. RTI2.2]MEB0230597.1 hypothetical protein [Undibacterium sp. 10I3]MEB0257083.1 hypothetical protein [Undibacterium sp. 5I1]